MTKIKSEGQLLQINDRIIKNQMEIIEKYRQENYELKNELIILNAKLKESQDRFNFVYSFSEVKDEVNNELREIIKGYKKNEKIKKSKLSNRTKKSKKSTKGKNNRVISSGSSKRSH